MPDSRLSAKYAALYYFLGAWAFAAAGIILGCMSGSIDTGPVTAEWWRRATFVALLLLAAMILAAVGAGIYSIWLHIRQFTTKWRQARLVPLGAGVISWCLFMQICALIMIATGGAPTEPTDNFFVNYSYLAVIPMTPVVLAEVSFQMFKSIDADIPDTPQGDESVEAKKT